MLSINRVFLSAYCYLFIRSESSLQGYTPIATLDHDGGEDRDGGQEQQQHPRYAFPLSDTGGMANMRTIEDLQDILCELPADFKGEHFNVIDLDETTRRLIQNLAHTHTYIYQANVKPSHQDHQRKIEEKRAHHMKDLMEV